MQIWKSKSALTFTKNTLHYQHCSLNLACQNLQWLLLALNGLLHTAWWKNNKSEWASLLRTSSIYSQFRLYQRKKILQGLNSSAYCIVWITNIVQSHILIFSAIFLWPQTPEQGNQNLYHGNVKLTTLSAYFIH